MHPGEISIQDYSYQLPETFIAKTPLGERDQSRLLIWKDGVMKEDIYRNIARFIPSGSLLVFNNTRVVAARLFFQKETGAQIEIFILEPADKDGELTQAMAARGKTAWKCLIGGAGKWKHGQVLEKTVDIDGIGTRLSATITGRAPGSFVVEFSWTSAEIPFSQILHAAGVMPIPPYLKRQSNELDTSQYQTIYAQHDGSVAAPTAGLHFTPKIFESMQDKDIDSAFVTLHVGAGTFMPVKSEKMQGHIMHAEFMEIDYSLLRKLHDHADNIMAVGTTSLRSLESIYWMGVKSYRNPAVLLEDLMIKQWDVYENGLPEDLTVPQALTALMQWFNRQEVARLIIKTQILLAPPYKMKMIRGLVTNFHQPNSTLLLLVAALIGENWRSVYQYALDNHFRFLSYGDGCLLFKP